MESDLDLIAEGKGDYKKIMSEFHSQLATSIDEAKKISTASIFKVDRNCPECDNGNRMIRKSGKYGVFLGCEGYPQCGYTIIIDEAGNEKETKVETGIPCPECGNKIVNKKGKFGEFYGCSAYPTCTWKGQVDAEGKIIEKKKKEVETSDIDCESCGKGKMVKRSGKFGVFLACNQYPECKSTIKLDESGNPVPKKATTTVKKPAVSVGKKCPKCSKDLVERNGKFGKFISCSGYPNCKHIEK
jgi:DNA topoisomerase-1